MGKIRSKVVRWQPSETPDVKYRFYWATCKAVSHSLGYENVETVTQVIISDDVPSFPLVASKIVWGVSAVTQAGNGSEVTAVTEDIDFTIPGAPGNFRIEDR